MAAHGFRTSASSLWNESDKWNPDAIERALAHMVAGSVRRIYNQSAYWRERVAMAQWLSDYLDELRDGGNVPRQQEKIEQIGKASCRERVCQSVYISVVAVYLDKKLFN